MGAFLRGFALDQLSNYTVLVCYVKLLCHTVSALSALNFYQIKSHRFRLISN